MRLPSLPIPKAGETIHSLVARHLARHASSRAAMLGIMDLKTSAAHGFIPSGALGLADIAPRGHPWHDDPRRMLEYHTLIPLFSSFFRLNLRLELMDHILNGTGNYARALIGSLPKEGLQTKTYRYCQSCLARDLLSGIPVSYRHHQPSFVRVCAEHCEPLVNGCTACFTSARGGSRWVMAGTCDCANPHFPPETIERRSGQFKTWLWIARQVKVLIDNPPPQHVSLSLKLSNRMLLRFKSPFGLNAQQISDEIQAAFEADILQTFGITLNAESGPYWPVKMVNRGVDVERGPLLRSLILSKLVCEDVSDLYTDPERPSLIVSAAKNSYTNIRAERSRHLTKEELVAALSKHEHVLSKAAESMGMWLYPFVGALIAHGIKSPLPERYIKLLGTKLDKIRNELKSGLPKKEIAERYGITLNVMDRIQLDQPQLAEDHRTSVFLRLRSHHRKSFEEYRSAHPDATRDQIAKALIGALNWLRPHDAEWLREAWPPKNSGSKSKNFKPVGYKRDWQSFDSLMEAAAIDFVADEKSGRRRPRRVTYSRVCHAIEILPANLPKMPRLQSVLATECETKDHFMERLIVWAVYEYSKLDIPLNQEAFRLLASLGGSAVKRHAMEIIREAKKLMIPIQGNSMFAALAESSGPSPCE